MIQNRITKKFLRLTNVNFFYADFIILKLEAYLQLPSTNTYGKAVFHTSELMGQLHVDPLVKNYVNVHEQPRDVFCSEMRR
jgi:hypothetical protein